MMLELMFVTVSQTFHIPPGLLSAMCYTESKHDYTSYVLDDRGSPSFGECQLKLATARQMGFKGRPSELMDPFTNIYFSGKYLGHQLKRYNGDIRKALSAYNAGTYRENSRGLTKNRKHVSKVFKNWSEDR